MFRSALSAVLMFAVISLTFAIPVAAQTKPTTQEEKATKVKDKLKKFGVGEKAKIKVKLISGTTYEGHVSSVNETDFVVVDKAGSSNTLKYSDVDKIGGKTLSNGAKIGIGIGIGAGLTVVILWLTFENYG
ncbi:MAG: hypothetical protein IPG58_00860 [Acidobacteria bacterium]|nr:hypothetical protein [Acidobacteriota bacterium]